MNTLRMCQITFITISPIFMLSSFQSSLDPFACSHHRAADYFTESIQSDRGFWGWPCNSYINYLLGMCPRSNELHLGGEDCRESSKGMFLVTTNSESPFASGQWTVQQTSKYPSNSRRDPFLEQIDEYGKLESAFNFANSYHKLSTPLPLSTQPMMMGAATTTTTTTPTINHFHPFEPLTNQINQNGYETTINNNYNNNIDVDKSRFDLYEDDDLKLGSTTERRRQNDKFILVENPLALALNRTMPELSSSSLAMLHHRQHQQQQQQQSGSGDEFQFPKVTYR